MEIEVWGRAELMALAGSPARARALVREGAVRRVLRNAYVGSEHEDTVEVRVAAVRRSLPPDTAVTGRAALWMLGVDVLERNALVDVVVPRGRNLRPQAGLRQHSALVGEAELHEHHGLLLVSPARVIIDAARLEAVHEAAVLGDASLRAGVTTPELLVQALERAKGLRGVLGARLVLPLLNPRSESPMESRVRVELALAGMETEAQTDLYDDGRHLGRADLHVRGVVLEYDGLVAHTSAPPSRVTGDGTTPSATRAWRCGASAPTTGICGRGRRWSRTCAVHSSWRRARRQGAPAARTRSGRRRCRLR